MRCEHGHATQVEPPIGHRPEDDREAAARPRDLDALVGGVGGELQLRHAIGKQGRICHGQEEPAHVDLGQVGQQVGGGAPFAFGMSDGAVMQGVIGDMGP
jgi:hypothetical protein